MSSFLAQQGQPELPAPAAKRWPADDPYLHAKAATSPADPQ